MQKPSKTFRKIYVVGFPRAYKETQDEAKMTPRWPKMAPRWPELAPRPAKLTPRWLKMASSREDAITTS